MLAGIGNLRLGFRANPGYFVSGMGRHLTSTGGSCVYADSVLTDIPGAPGKKYFSLRKLGGSKLDDLPFSIRVLLESTARNCDNIAISEQDVNRVLDWQQSAPKALDVTYMPARVILQDFTGVPLVADLAAMRDIVAEKGHDPGLVNPITPVDLVIDHSVQVDHSGDDGALAKNEGIEAKRNKERYMFLKWGQSAFNGFKIVPPGSGIVHQVNLEHLARVAYEKDNVMYPDSVIGTDSHTTMIGGLGVLGWGVGGIEAEGVMLGQPISIRLPEVVGVHLTGQFGPGVTATDLVLEVTEKLREANVVGKFVEFFGSGLKNLTVADRATIANMCPEYGATVGYFPIDETTIEYMRETGRNEQDVDLVKKYVMANDLWNDYSQHSNEKCKFTKIIQHDISAVMPCVSGPKRPQDRITLDNVSSSFKKALCDPIGHQGFGLSQTALHAHTQHRGENGLENGMENGVKNGVKNGVDKGSTGHVLHHGDIVIAAITSCTNTSNPSVMLGAGLLAKNACDKGLTIAPYVKRSLSPGSRVVTEYLKNSGLLPYLEKMGFYLTGYGCQTCIGNSGPLDESILDQVSTNPDLVLASVLSGNRNFEGRVHASTKANYLASPPLVVAYAIAGNIQLDLTKSPIGVVNEKSIYLNEIWPSNIEINNVIKKTLSQKMFRDIYGKPEFYIGPSSWASLEACKGMQYAWDEQSTYVRRPPFFTMSKKPSGSVPLVEGGRILLSLGNSVTTDHISPAGSIAMDSPASRYLQEHGIEKKDYNTYGARRGNDVVMTMGTFGNIRINNMITPREGPKTVYFPKNTKMTVFDAAMKYKETNTPLIVIAGSLYGTGSSRDWAAKGPFLLGVTVVIAQSFERIHRSNLIQMGILPLEFIPEESVNSPSQIPPHYIININTLNKDITVNGTVQGLATPPTQNETYQPDTSYFPSTTQPIPFKCRVRLDTPLEKSYFLNGGILPYVLENAILNK